MIKCIGHPSHALHHHHLESKNSSDMPTSQKWYWNAVKCPLLTSYHDVTRDSRSTDWKRQVIAPLTSDVF